MNFQAIQALRGIAAMMVLLMHARIAVWWAKDLWNIPFISAHGMIGVSLFFCISGFIIAHVVSRSAFEPASFIVKRVWRIVPIYWIVTTLALIFWWASRFWWRDVERLGVEGIVKGYLMFPQQGFPLVNPGWSLEHEVIFYVLAAIVVPFARLVGLFIALIALWVVGRFYTGWDYHLFSYSQIYFAAGIAAYWSREVSPKILLSISFVFCLLTVFNLYKVIEVSSTIAIMITALGCSSLIAGLVSMENKGLGFPKWLVSVGDASYSIYIVHWIVLPWVGYVAYRIGGSMELWRWMAFAVCMLIGFISRKYLEIPLMKVSVIRKLYSVSPRNAKIAS
ncbi:acyltransferase family protein [Pseudomonas sp. CCNWLW250]|uniref:acyltransferase family protein n=1 Tax=Pseudomonas sp. CCNWLW250 TaxID=3128886 RepID=UPI00307ECC8A